MTSKYFATRLALVLGGAFSAPLYAVSDDTIVITATRTEQTLASTVAPTTVLTRQDIAKYQSKDLYELLSHVPGLNVTRQGARGAQSSIFIRGTNSEHALILLDGQRIASASVGTTAFQFLNPEQIDRIEVVRGPRASLYGSDAIGGVIQIFTRKGRDKTQGILQLGAGNHRTQEHMAGINGQTSTTSFNFNQSYSYSNGINVRRLNEENSKDSDAFINQAFNTRIHHQLNNRTHIGGSYLKNEGEVEYDSSFADKPFHQFEIESFNTYLAADINQYWDFKLSGGKSRDFLTAEDDLNSNILIFETNRNSASFQNNIHVDENHSFILAYDYFDDELDGTGTYKIDSRKTEAVIAQYLTELGPHSFVVGVREDEIEDTATKVTGSIDWGWNINQRLQTRLSFGEGFRAPTVSSLHGSSAKPELKPEESKNIELGIQGHESNFLWQANIFQNQIKQLLEWDYAEGAMGNIAEAEIRGAEFIFSSQIQDWSLATNLTFLIPENKKTGKQLIKRPKRAINIDVDRNWKKFDFGASLLARSHRFDFDNVELGGYGIVNLRGAYRYAEQLKFQLSLTNIFDKKYQDAEGYNSEGLGALLSVVYTPDL